MSLLVYRFVALAACLSLVACTGKAAIQVTPTGESEGKGPSVRRSGVPASGGPSATPSARASGTAITPVGQPTGLASTTLGVTPPPGVDLMRADLATLTGKVKAVAGVLANNGGQLLGNNGATLVANNAGNLISDKGAGYRLQAIDEVPVAGTAIYVVGDDGKPLPGVQPVLTDAQGNYTLTGVPKDRAYLIRALIKTAGGKEAALETIGQAAAQASPLLVSTASAMVTVAVFDDRKGDLTGFDAVKFQAAVDATAAKLTLADIPDFADRAAVKAAIDKLAAQVAELQVALDAVKSQLDALEDKLDDLLKATPKPTPTPTPAFTLTTLAGSPFQGYGEGQGPAARFTKPVGIAVDPQGGYYVSEFNNHTVRKVAADGTTTTYAGTGQPGHLDAQRGASLFAAPTGLAINPDGNLYVAEYGANCIRRIFPTGQVLTLAGDGTPESLDGGPGLGRLNGPCGLVRDPDNNLFIAEFEGNRIRKLAPDGTLTTVAGASDPGSVDGTGTAARFNKPYGLAWDPLTATLVVADNASNSIRRVTREGVVTTIAGGGAGAFADGKGTNARFWGPIGVAVDAQGVIYVGDTKNGRIRRIQPDGTVDSVAGTGVTGYADGGPTAAQVGAPYLMAIDPLGFLVFADYPNHCVRRAKLP